jgi:hypothetical protein
VADKDVRPDEGSPVRQGCLTGDTGVNPCPCGSGKAFARCHGAECECGSKKPKYKCCHADEL